MFNVLLQVLDSGHLTDANRYFFPCTETLVALIRSDRALGWISTVMPTRGEERSVSISPKSMWRLYDTLLV